MLRLAGCLILLFMAASPLPAEDLKTSAVPQTPTIARYRQALTIDPGNLPLHYYLGISLLTEGYNQEAVAEFRLAYPGFSDSVEMNYNFALALTRLGDPDSALIYLVRAEELGAAEQPELFPLSSLYFNLALLYINVDELDEAARLLHKVLGLSGPAVEAHRLLGDIYLRQDKPQQAEEQWLKVLNRQPGDATAREYLYTIRFNRGLQALGNKDFPAAETAFFQAIELEPESSLAGYYLGYLAYQQQAWSRAITQLTEVADTLPAEMQESLSAMVYNSAATLLKEGQPDAARPAIKVLAASTATEIQSHYLAGNIHLAMEQYPEARTQYLQILDQDPGHIGANLNLLKADQGTSETYYLEGRELFRQRDLPAAIAKLEAALRINPGHGMARSYLEQSQTDLASEGTRLFADARIELEAGNPTSALNKIRRGLYLQPGDAQGLTLEQAAVTAMDKQINALLGDATSLLQAGADSEAEQYYLNVLKLVPDNQGAVDGLENIRKQREEQVNVFVLRGQEALENGQLTDARNAYQAALALAPDHSAATVGLERTGALVTSLVDEELQWARRARQAGQLTEAREHYRKALRLNDDIRTRREMEELEAAASVQITSLLESSQKALRKGELNQARALLSKAEAVAPNRPDVRQRRLDMEADIALQVRQQLEAGRQQLAKEDYQSALASYRGVLDLEPANQEAIAGLKKGRSNLEGQLVTLVNSGSKAIDAGAYVPAETALQKALQLDPYHRQAKLELERLNTIRNAGLSPEDAQRLYLEGIDLYTKGSYIDAVAAWEQVLILQPEHVKAQMNIEKARRKLAQIKAFNNG